MPDPDPPARQPSATEERYRLLVEHSPDMVALFGTDGRFMFASGAYERILGYPIDEVVAGHPLDRVHPEDRDRVAAEILAQLKRTRPLVPVEFRIRHRDGRYLYVEAVVVDLVREPAVRGILVASRDVTDRKRAEMAVQDQARVLERVARGAPIAETLDELCRMAEHRVDDALAVVFVREGRGLRVAAGPSVPNRLRAALDAVSGQPGVRERLRGGLVVGAVGDLEERSAVLDTLVDAGRHAWWAAPIFASDGETVLGTLTTLMPDLRTPTPGEEQVLTAIGSLAAIALERDASQTRLAHQASHDALTGLLNREQLMDRLRRVVDRVDQAEHATAAVLFLDLDRFKVLNDSVGHDGGDRLLVAVAQRLRAALRERDTVARFGGDEFVVLCEDLADPDEVVPVAERLRSVVEQPFVVDGVELVVTASVGVAVVDGRSADAPLRDADTAMYHAKERGRARVEVFDEHLRSRVVDRLDVERDLRRALDADELVLHYQPVVSLRTGHLTGFEALVRWQHPTRGLLGPDQFIAVAEDAGLLTRMGLHAQRTALAQWAEWHADHPEWSDFVVGVNLAAVELRDGSLPEQIATLVQETGADPRLLVVEVSERVLAEDTDAARATLEKVRALGLLVSLDDFGTGSSPLLHLRRLPITAVKLDGALIAGLGVNRDDNVLVSGVIDLAHRLGLFVVAEGVENTAQVERLRAYGCLLAQGHHFAPAMPPADAAAWADEFRLDWEQAVRSR